MDDTSYTTQTPVYTSLLQVCEHPIFHSGAMWAHKTPEWLKTLSVSAEVAGLQKIFSSR